MNNILLHNSRLHSKESERLKKRIKEQDEEIEKLREAIQFRDNFLTVSTYCIRLLLTN